MSRGFLMILDTPIMALEKHFLIPLADKTECSLKRNVHIFKVVYVFFFQFSVMNLDVLEDFAIQKAVLFFLTNLLFTEDYYLASCL